MGKRSPGYHDRHDRSSGRPIVGVHTAIEPPPVPPGKVRCPVCRNVTSETPTGRLRQHRDLLGLDCWNKAPLTLELEENPAPAKQGNLLSPTGVCHGEGCGKRVTGERKFCGACAAARL